MTVDADDPTPLYQQLAALLAEQIRSGELEPGDSLPSETYLCGTHGVSRGTVRRAMEVLRDQGLAVTVPQRRTYVTPRERWR